VDSLSESLLLILQSSWPGSLNAALSGSSGRDARDEDGRDHLGIPSSFGNGS